MFWQSRAIIWLFLTSFIGLFSALGQASTLDASLLSYTHIHAITHEDALSLGVDKVSLWSMLPLDLTEEVIIFDWDETLCSYYLKEKRNGSWLRYFPIHSQSLDKILNELLDRGATVVILTASAALSKIILPDHLWDRSFAKIGNKEFGFSKNTLNRMRQKLLDMALDKSDPAFQSPIFYAPWTEEGHSTKDSVLGQILENLNEQLKIFRFIDNCQRNVEAVSKLQIRDDAKIFIYLFRSELLLKRKYEFYYSEPQLLENAAISFWIKDILRDKIKSLNPS